MQELLRQVSRSFYLTLRILPNSINAQLSLAYLLARAADTVADTQLVEIWRRREALRQIRSSIQEACEGRTPRFPDLGELRKAQKQIAGEGTPGERLLLEKLGKIFEALKKFSADDRLQIRKVLDTITQGQEMDLIRFEDSSVNHIAALASDEELDEYTYKVAGCVGEFWTHMCRTHIFPSAQLDDAVLLGNGIRFGKGLQFVNILRDLPKDLRQGRCYIPRDQLSKHGLEPRDLLETANMSRFRPLYNEYLQQAENHLAAGWAYTTMLPFRFARIRLACSWPIFIGVQTVETLRRNNILDDRLHIHISQSDIRRLIFRSIILYPKTKSWNSLFDSVRNRESGRLKGRSFAP